MQAGLPPLFIRIRITKLHLLHCICMPPYGCRTCVHCRCRRRRRQSVKPSPLPPVKPKLIPNRPRRSRSYSSSMTDNKQADTAAANSKLSSLSYSSSSRFFLPCCYITAKGPFVPRPVRQPPLCPLLYSRVPQEIFGEIWRVKISNSDLRYIDVHIGCGDISGFRDTSI